MNTDKFPLVSVVIPMFNAQDWIIGLLESIVNQSYQSIEVILVNDGSTDASAEIVSKFSKQEIGIEIRIVSQKNSGIRG